MKSLLLSSVMFLATYARRRPRILKPLNSDTEPDRIDWSQLDDEVRPFPKMPPGTTKVGAVSKTLTTNTGASSARATKNFGKKVGVPVSYQAAQSEGDQLGQLSIAETMITQGASVLLVSPQTNSNLEPAMGEAKAAGIPVRQRERRRHSDARRTTSAMSSAIMACESPNGFSRTGRRAANWR